MKAALLTLALFVPVWAGLGTIQAQSPVFGVTAGASINSVSLDGLDNVSTDFNSVKGVEGGVYVSFLGPGFYVRPMALASFLRGTVETQEQEAQARSTDFQLTTLEVPVIAGLRILPGIALEGGPSWNYLMSYTKSVGSVNLDLDRHSLGYRAGVRVTLSRFGIFGHYGGIIDSGSESAYHLRRPSRIVVGATLDLSGGK